MNNKKIKASQQNHHDDCEDCRRQKKENAALIAIYERLQAIDSKSKNMRNSIDTHRKQCIQTRSKFGEFTMKFSSLPKQNKTTLQLEKIGHELAKQMLEDSLRGKTKKQNQKLKTILKRIHKSKNNDKFVQPSQKKNNSTVIQSKTQVLYNPSMTQSGYPINFYKEAENQKSNIRYVGQIISEEEEPGDTKTTGFYLTRNHRTFHETKITDSLNLWLYNNDINKSLEESLFQNKAPTLRSTRLDERKQKFLPQISSYSKKG